MEIDVFNRMEKSGANRKIMKSILVNDRKLVSRLFMQAAVSVLQKDYDFTYEQVNDFREKIQAEIDQMR